MNFSNIAKDLGNQALSTINYILTLKISDSEKRAMLTRLFSQTGYAFYNKMFNDSSELFDSTALKTVGFQNPNSQIERLSAKLVQNNNLGRKTESIIREFYDSVLGDAQNESFRNARSLGKHPTLTRILRGETCAWCRARTGTFINPDGEMFARHDNCDCLFITKGFNSRNGILKNYTKSTNSKNRREIESLDEIFKNTEPGVGNISRENGTQIPKRKAHEKETFQWLKKEVGGDFIILNESKTPMPDGIRNNTEIIEVKRVSTSSSIDTGIRQAIKQTSNTNLAKTNISNYRKMNKIAILDGRGKEYIEGVSYNEAQNIIERRIIREATEGKDVSLNYVVIRRNNGNLLYKI